MTEIGTAYVKVRPNFAGFKGETESGVKQALVGVGKTVAGVFAIKGAFDFGKELITDAARVQKSAETIRAEFGAAGAAVTEFADGAGLKLGIASHVSEDAAARFGILFKNIGVGQENAAAMTVNLEKLAGSIAAIRGKDPGDVLGSLPLALSGSLRGLRQLGFAFTPVQLKEEALRLGLIKTKQQALDPGARALAIYGLVTQHLGDYQQQAAAHADDAFNIQKRLSAEWDHAKETLGLRLLPEISRYGGELSDWIDKAVKSGEVQRDFNTIVRDAKAVIGDTAAVVKELAGGYRHFRDLVGGDHNAASLLASSFGLLYAQSKLIKWGIIAGGEKAVGGAAVVSTAEVGGLKGALVGLSRLGPIVIPIVIEQILKSPKGKGVRKDASDLQSFTDVLLHGDITKGADWKKFGGSLRDVLFGSALPKAPKSAFTGGLTAFDKGGSLNSLTILKEGQLAAANARTAAGDVTKAIGDGVGDQTPHLKKSVLDALKAPVDAARQSLAQAKQQLAADIAAMPGQITDAVNQAKQNLNSITSQLTSDIGAALDKRGGAEQLGPVLSRRLKDLMGRVNAGTADARTVRLAQELQNQQVARAQLAPDPSALKDKVARQFADLSDVFNKGGIGLKGFDRRVDQILKTAGVHASVIARTQGVAAADQFRADLSGLKRQAAAITASPHRPGTGLAPDIVRPLDAIRTQEAKISDDRKAEAQAQRAVEHAQLDQTKKTNALLQKMEAKLPSRHDTAAVDALLRRQGALSPTAQRARERGTTRQGR